jgi:hypothetical protein
MDPTGLASVHPGPYASVLDAHIVTVHDARRAYGLGFDRSGFELLRHHGTLGNWQAFSDATLVREVDYPEVGRAIQVRLRASKVLVIDHRLRAAGPTWEAAPRRFEPVRRVQPVPTFRFAAQQVLRHLDGAEAAKRLQQRFALVHVWRPIAGRAKRVPLALCDARTIKGEELLAGGSAHLGRPDQSLAIGFSFRHRWYWFPDHSPQEATLVKVFDSSIYGQAVASTYTAFDYVGSQEDAAKGSIESRTLVFW